MEKRISCCIRLKIVKIKNCIRSFVEVGIKWKRLFIPDVTKISSNKMLVQQKVQRNLSEKERYNVDWKNIRAIIFYVDIL